MATAGAWDALVTERQSELPASIFGLCQARTNFNLTSGPRTTTPGLLPSADPRTEQPAQPTATDESEKELREVSHAAGYGQRSSSHQTASGGPSKTLSKASARCAQCPVRPISDSVCADAL